MIAKLPPYILCLELEPGMLDPPPYFLYRGGNWGCWILPKRIEYKEATLRFGWRHLLIFTVFLGLHRERERGGGWYWTLFMAAILLAGILTVFSQRTSTLSILKEINTTKYKDFYLTRWRRKLAICHHYRHSDKCIFTMFFKSEYAKLKFMWQLNCLHWRPVLPTLCRTFQLVQKKNSAAVFGCVNGKIMIYLVLP